MVQSTFPLLLNTEILELNNRPNTHCHLFPLLHNCNYKYFQHLKNKDNLISYKELSVHGQELHAPFHDLK